MTIRPARPDEILDLRHRTLRAGLPPETARFDGDEDPDTRHFVAIDNDGRVIGCVTILRNDWNGEPAWQLRGMAVEPGLQGSGVGRRLLEATEQAVVSDGRTRLMWCNARVPAVGFYERHEWHVASDEFDIPTAGPHRKMIRRL